MSRSGTQSPGNSLETLLHVDDKRTLYVRRTNPLSRFVQNFQAPNWILGKKSEKPSGVFMWAHALRSRL